MVVIKMSALDRLTRKVDKIVNQSKGDEEVLDDRIDREIEVQELLTLGLLPVNSTLRTFVLGCLLRAKERREKLAKLKEQVKEDDLVPVEVHGGGKCKITLFMTRAAAERERGR